MCDIKLNISGSIESSAKNELKKSGFTLFKKNSMLGVEALWTIAGTLSVATLGAVTKIVVEAIKSKSLIEITINGKKIKASGISQEMAERLIRESLESD